MDRTRKPTSCSPTVPAVIARLRFTATTAKSVSSRGGTEDDAETETVDVETCGLCGGDTLKKDNFKDCVLRLWRRGRGINRRYGPGVTLGVAGCLL